MKETILDYIRLIYKVKGGITLHKDGKKIYHSDVVSDIMTVFCIGEIELLGIMLEVFWDTDLDYEHYANIKKPDILAACFCGVDFTTEADSSRISRYYRGSIDVGVIIENLNYKPIIDHIP